MNGTTCYIQQYITRLSILLSHEMLPLTLHRRGRYRSTRLLQSFSANVLCAAIASVYGTLTRYYTSGYDSYHHMTTLLISYDDTLGISTEASASYGLAFSPASSSSTEQDALHSCPVSYCFICYHPMRFWSRWYKGYTYLPVMVCLNYRSPASSKLYPPPLSHTAGTVPPPPIYHSLHALSAIANSYIIDIPA